MLQKKNWPSALSRAISSAPAAKPTSAMQPYSPTSNRNTTEKYLSPYVGTWQNHQTQLPALQKGKAAPPPEAGTRRHRPAP